MFYTLQSGGKGREKKIRDEKITLLFQLHAQKYNPTVNPCNNEAIRLTTHPTFLFNATLDSLFIADHIGACSL